MIHAKVVFPDEIQQELDSLYHQFFDQYDEYDEIEDGAVDAYIDAHASEKLKEILRENREYLASLPPGVHV